jgi:membrane protein required for colicin V production
VNFSVLDIIFAVLILLLTLRCFFKGLITEVMSMASLVLGLLVAFLFHKPAAAYVAERWLPDSRILADIIATAALFIIVFVAIKLLERIIQDIIQAVDLGGLDRFLGLIFGFVEGVLLVTLIVWLISIQPIFDPEPLLESSVIAQILLPLAGSGQEYLEKSGGA